MDAVEFIKTRARMCRAYDNCGCCSLCDFCAQDYGEQDSYQVAEQAVANVVEWAKEHPVKTRQGEFLKMYPEAEIFEGGYLNICPGLISKEYRDEETNECSQPEFSCGKCKRNFWLKEIE